MKKRTTFVLALLLAMVVVTPTVWGSPAEGPSGLSWLEKVTTWVTDQVDRALDAIEKHGLAGDPDDDDDDGGPPPPPLQGITATVDPEG